MAPLLISLGLFLLPSTGVLQRKKERIARRLENPLEARACCTSGQMLVPAAMSRGPNGHQKLPLPGDQVRLCCSGLSNVCRGQGTLPGGRCSQIDIQLPLPIAKNTSEAKLLKIIKETRDWKLSTNALNAGQNLTFKTSSQQISKQYYYTA